MQNSNSTKATQNLSKVIKIDEAQIRDHLGDSSVFVLVNACEGPFISGFFFVPFIEGSSLRSC